MYVDSNNLARVRRDIIKNKKPTDAEIMIKIELKTVRNEKGNPQADNTETQLECDETFLGFDSEGEAVLLKDC